MKNKISINLGFYFPFSMMFLGILGCVSGLVLLIPRPLIALPLLLIGAIILSARYRVDISLTALTYHDYLWIAGFKKGKKGKFQSIDCLYITKTKYSQRVNSRISTMTKYGTQYNGYIRFDTDDVHLLSNDNKEKVVSKLRKVSEKLKGDIVVNSNISINAAIIDYSEKTEEKIE